ncbi:MULTISPECIES: hypothetical protein [Lactobacillus]|nr:MULTISPECIES: hypothetical protein [Lactobacillus]
MKKPKITIIVNKNSKKEVLAGVIGWLLFLIIIGLIVWKLI